MTSLTHEQFQRLTEFNLKAARAASPSALMALGEEAFQAEFGYKLFTLLKIDRESGLMRRIYSSNLEINPVGGTKPIVVNDWSRLVLERGEHYIGLTRDDIQSVYPDYENLFGIGCGSAINVPVLWRGVVIGSVNILHVEGHYTPELFGLTSLYGQCLAPAFLSD